MPSPHHELVELVIVNVRDTASEPKASEANSIEEVPLISFKEPEPVNELATASTVHV
jgi:hypothetical protein